MSPNSWLLFPSKNSWWCMHVNPWRLDNGCSPVSRFSNGALSWNLNMKLLVSFKRKWGDEYKYGKGVWDESDQFWFVIIPCMKSDYINSKSCCSRDWVMSNFPEQIHTSNKYLWTYNNGHTKLITWFMDFWIKKCTEGGFSYAFICNEWTFYIFLNKMSLAISSECTLLFLFSQNMSSYAMNGLFFKWKFHVNG